MAGLWIILGWLIVGLAICTLLAIQETYCSPDKRKELNERYERKRGNK